ncbi:TetR/AcrR family transcriptional regulator [Cryobacterium melibiosiphilum]|uniref:TetR/AcrR family transcriptional regulator n=1 Tax=Cryobacterium melibiosiphilum TaxID=995039 RepID=UPI0018F77C8B|nr:TetR/AcrR family transcriptional regulator [Cryobacterium melibiosiphilum]
MRTAKDIPPADLTAQARIRDAAIGHFAADGFDKANLRAIAATAEVSAALVLHHFGSKAGLRTACDDFVLGDLMRTAHDETSPEGLQDVIRRYTSNAADYQSHLDYIGRAIKDGSPTARRFVDTIIDESEAIVLAGIADGSMRPSSDPRALAVFIAMSSLAMMTLAPVVARSLGFEMMGPAVLQRMALPSLELYTHGLYTDDTFLVTTQQALAAVHATDPQQDAHREEHVS